MKRLFFALAAILFSAVHAQAATIKGSELPTTNRITWSNMVFVITMPGDTNYGTRVMSAEDFLSSMLGFTNWPAKAPEGYVLFGAPGGTNLTSEAQFKYDPTNNILELVAGSLYTGGNIWTSNKFIGYAALHEVGEMLATNSFRFKARDGSAYSVRLRGPLTLPGAADMDLFLPGTNGLSGQALVNDGSGGLYWASLAAAAGVTNLGDVYVVATNGTRTSGFGLEPYGSISNAVWEATHSTPRPITILVLPGTHTLTAWTNDLGGGAVNLTNWSSPVRIVGLGNAVISSPNREGTIFRVNNVGDVTFENITLSSLRNTNVHAVYGPGPGIGIMFGGNCGDIRLINVRFQNFQRFGSGVFHYQTDNTFTNLFYAHSCVGSNLGSWYTNGFNSYDGALFVLPSNSEIYNCHVFNSAQGFEIYGDDTDSSNAPNRRIHIENCHLRNIISHHLFVGGYTNNWDVTVRGCTFIDDPSWVRYDGSNYVTGGTAFSLNLSGIQNLIFEDNFVQTHYASVFQWTSGAKNVFGGRVRRNIFFGGHTQIVIGNDGSGRGNYNFTVEDNDLVDFGGRGMQLIGVQDGVIFNNRGNNGSTNGSLAFIYLAGTGNAHASNIIVEANSHMDSSGSTTVTYGLEIAAGSTQIRAVNNRFDSVATGQISDAGTNTMVYSRTQSGVGIGTNSPAAPLHVHGRAYINGTNAARAFHFTGGQATNSLLYIDGGTNAGVVTIGANLTLTAGTLAASGGSASTNDTVEAIGSVISGFIDNTNQLYTRGLVIPPQATGASVNASNSFHRITTNAFTTFTFDGTLQLGTRLWLQVSNSSTTNITFAIPSAFDPEVQANTTSWTIAASNMATRCFLRTTNAAGAMWFIELDAGMKYSFAADIGLTLRTNATIVTLTPTNQTATIASNASSATVDFTTTRRVLVHSFGNTNLVLSPTNLVDGAQISVEGQGTPNNFDVTFTNAAGTVVRWPLGVSTNGSTSFTVTNGQGFAVVLTVVSNRIHADLGRYR